MIKKSKNEKSSNPILKAESLTRLYEMGEVTVRALENVNLEVHKGEFIVLLGPSGSGKSTLLNLIGGLDIPTSGKIYFHGRDIFSFPGDYLTLFRRNHIGFVFQFYNLIPSLTALENISLVTDISHQPMEARKALDLVGMGSRSGHFPAQLSGGEQQRVAIARAISKKPDILLCDEPTGALDIRTGRTVLEAIESVNRELGTTTIIITHNASIAGMADRILTMKDGSLQSDKMNTKRLEASEISW